MLGSGGPNGDDHFRSPPIVLVRDPDLGHGGKLQIYFIDCNRRRSYYFLFSSVLCFPYKGLFSERVEIRGLLPSLQPLHNILYLHRPGLLVLRLPSAA